MLRFTTEILKRIWGRHKSVWPKRYQLAPGEFHASKLQGRWSFTTTGFTPKGPGMMCEIKHYHFPDP
jgi:hypothetical protein